MELVSQIFELKDEFGLDLHESKGAPVFSLGPKYRTYRNNSWVSIEARRLQTRTLLNEKFGWFYERLKQSVEDELGAPAVRPSKYNRPYLF